MRKVTTGSDFECYVDQSARLNGNIQVGRFTYLTENALTWGRSNVSIGSFCSIGANFQCLTHEQHPIQFASTFPMGLIVGVPITHGDMKGLDPEGNVIDPNPIVIGHDVWIGKDVSVFGGVTIGHGCIIGAKSLVNKDCVPYGIYAGVPAKLIRMRFPEEIIRQLLDIKWWDWSVQKLRSNARFFDTDFTRYTSTIGELVIEPSLAA